MSEASRWSLGSSGSVLSIGSQGSVLSVGSVGSFCSVGSIGSAFSAFSVGSWMSTGSALSSQSRWSLLSHQSYGASMRTRAEGPLTPAGPPALLLGVAVVAWAGYRWERRRRAGAPAREATRGMRNGSSRSPQLHDQRGGGRGAATAAGAGGLAWRGAASSSY